jgi:hypothetical protein
LEYEKNQAIECWTRIKWDAFNNSIDKLVSALQNQNVSLKAKKTDINSRVRKLHDRLGYRAFGSGLSGLGQGGLCAGALYRSESFIKTKQELRDGRNRNKQDVPEHLVTVHIEHTVPVGVLVSQLIAMSNITQLSSEVVQAWLLRYSVTTAMLHEQGRSGEIVRSGYSSKTNVFVDNHDDKNYPFRRYQSASDRIFNIVDGSEVPLNDFSFDDHAENVFKFNVLIKWPICGLERNTGELVFSGGGSSCEDQSCR